VSVSEVTSTAAPAEIATEFKLRSLAEVPHSPWILEEPPEVSSRKNDAVPVASAVVSPVIALAVATPLLAAPKAVPERVNVASNT
jgi:hypothetical protein